MAVHGVNINQDSLQLITSILTEVQRQGGIASDGELWPFIDTSAVSTGVGQAPRGAIASCVYRCGIVNQTHQSHAACVERSSFACERKLGEIKTSLISLALYCGIRMLPDEILEIILDIVIQEDTRWLDPSLVLSHRSGMSISHLRMRVERSEDLPLTAVIRTDRLWKGIDPIYELIVNNPARWRSVVFLWIDRWGFYFPRKYENKINLPNVEYFSACNIHPLLDAWEMPKVTRIKFKDTLPSPTSPFFSSSSITTLEFCATDIGIVAPDRICELFCALPNLVELWLEISEEYSNEMQDCISFCILPNLRRLCLRVRFEWMFIRFIRMQMPALETLVLDINDKKSRDGYIPFWIGLLDHLTCPSVRELAFKFRRRFEQRVALEHFFRAFANLEKLELDVADISEVRMTENGTKQIIPPLRSVLIHQSTNSKIDKDFLTEFAREMKENGQWDAFERFELRLAVS